MEPIIFSPKIDNLANLVEEGARANKKSTFMFIEPAIGTLNRARSKRHHLIFGRRGSGKSSLLLKSEEELTNSGNPVAYIDLEAFKGHHYPDVLISVLMATMYKFQKRLEKLYSDELSGSILSRVFANKKKKENLNEKEGLLRDLKLNIDELTRQLHLSDNALIKSILTDSSMKSLDAESSLNTKVGIDPISAGIENRIALAAKAAKNIESQEEFKRSKIDYLHRKIIDYRKIFQKIAEISELDCYLLLDDLYHIQRYDQPTLLDYFHRIAKGNSFWIKVGTIKNRSSWYKHGVQQIGLKLGDDADEINLDITLEKFSTSKQFLTKVLDEYIKQVEAPNMGEFIADGAIDRLVLSSGAVTRDFLGIFRKSIDETRERLSGNPSHPRGDKIGAEDVNQAAGSYGETKREEFSKDTLDDKEKLEEALFKIREFCLDTIKKNVFLIDQDLGGQDYDLVNELIDLRLIHHIQSRVTLKDCPGKIYKALMLDISQYTGARKRKDINLIEFWKAKKRDELRKRSLIYNPITQKSAGGMAENSAKRCKIPQQMQKKIEGF